MDQTERERLATVIEGRAKDLERLRRQYASSEGDVLSQLAQEMRSAMDEIEGVMARVANEPVECAADLRRRSRVLLIYADAVCEPGEASAFRGSLKSIAHFAEKCVAKLPQAAIAIPALREVEAAIGPILALVAGDPSGLC